MFLVIGSTSLLIHGLATGLLTFLIGEGLSDVLLFTIWLKVCAFLDSGRVVLLCATISSIFVLRRLFDKRQGLPEVQHVGPVMLSEPLRPLIFPCRTTHTRLFPKKHDLSYSYLQVGIPVGWRGSNSILGFDNGGPKPWFSIRTADYLSRGQEGSSLDEKLSVYLSSQGESLKDYAHAYLVTAPRFLGYAFNPVSFWYLFSSDLRLEAMILEVNNTFDERRMYFMKRGKDTEVGTLGDDPKFTHTWPKDFHVSPFNSRKGDYSLAAINPFASSKDGSPKINNVITLKSSKGHAKIVARVFSTGSALDPTQMRTWDTIRLISSWFWVGFLTFPRILKEAAKLFFQRKLHVWYRPEVVKTSIGRRPSKREQVIESTFQSFLRERVSLSSASVSLDYLPPTGSTADTLQFTSKQSPSDSSPSKIVLQVLTPQFYTDVVTSAPADYVSASATQPVDSQTFTTTCHGDLVQLLGVANHLSEQSSISFTTSVRAYVLSLLRRTGAQRHVLDEWVLYSTSVTATQKNAYFKSATVLVLAERGLAGFDVLLNLMLLAMQIGFAWRGTGFMLDLIRVMI